MVCQFYKNSKTPILEKKRKQIFEKLFITEILACLAVKI